MLELEVEQQAGLPERYGIPAVIASIRKLPSFMHEEDNASRRGRMPGRLLIYFQAHSLLGGRRDDVG